MIINILAFYQNEYMITAFSAILDEFIKALDDFGRLQRSSLAIVLLHNGSNANGCYSRNSGSTTRSRHRSSRHPPPAYRARENDRPAVRPKREFDPPTRHRVRMIVLRATERKPTGSLTSRAKTRARPLNKPFACRPVTFRNHSRSSS
jgi:hypothetical protein